MFYKITPGLQDQHQDHSVQDQDRIFWVSDRSCPKTDDLRPHHWIPFSLESGGSILKLRDPSLVVYASVQYYLHGQTWMKRKFYNNSVLQYAVHTTSWNFRGTSAIVSPAPILGTCSLLFISFIHLSLRIIDSHDIHKHIPKIKTKLNKTSPRLIKSNHIKYLFLI